MPQPDWTVTYVTGENPTGAKMTTSFRNNPWWVKGAIPPYTASTISALAADNSYNDSAAGFPAWALNPGDRVFTLGAHNIGAAVIVSATTTKLVVSGLTLVDAAAGGEIRMAFNQAFTSRGVETRASQFIHNTVDDETGIVGQPELRHTYAGTPGGSQFRFLRNFLAAAFANGTMGKLIGSVTDETEFNELVGFIQWLRDGVSTGSLVLDSYYDNFGNQAAHARAGIRIDSTGKVLICSDQFTGTYELEVGGNIRAAHFLQAGAEIGVWELDTSSGFSTMTFAGDAEAETWQSNSLVVASTTMASVNVPRLDGYGWMNDSVFVATPTGVTVPARFGLPTWSSTLTLPTISVDPSDNSFNDPDGNFEPGLFIVGDTVTGSDFEAPQNNRTFTIESITSTKIIVSGGDLVEEAAGADVSLEFRAGFTTILETPPVERPGYYEIKGQVTVPYSAPGHLGSLVVAKLNGSPLSQIFGDGCTAHYVAGRRTGEVETIPCTSRYNAAEGEILRLQVANTSEAALSCKGTLTAAWKSGGQDVMPRRLTLTLVLGTLTVT